MRLQFVEAGEIVSTHGIRGEVKVLPWGDSPEFLLEFARVRIAGADYKVESCRVQKTCNLLKLQGWIRWRPAWHCVVRPWRSTVRIQTPR